MQPLSTALAGVGATGCASGSHMWSGTAPALIPKPARSSATADRDADRAAAPRISASPSERASLAARMNARSRNVSPTTAITMYTRPAR
jgi:hypothetical protein